MSTKPMSDRGAGPRDPGPGTPAASGPGQPVAETPDLNGAYPRLSDAQNDSRTATPTSVLAYSDMPMLPCRLSTAGRISDLM